ncbi:MAG: winged helix-turn-helix transcriptional regulator [Candidatus Omnitrophica bacterium]|nr:winged helix-turn-helix transcriptional regulator [Candidatus Omnitrophota bacterium]
MDCHNGSELLKALAHPVRLRIVEGLLRHECRADKMVKALKLPQSTASQHLGVLKSRGIVQIRKEGVKTCYRVVDQKTAPLLKILDQKNG